MLGSCFARTGRVWCEIGLASWRKKRGRGRGGGGRMLKQLLRKKNFKLFWYFRFSRRKYYPKKMNSLSCFWRYKDRQSKRRIIGYILSRLLLQNVCSLPSLPITTSALLIVAVLLTDTLFVSQRLKVPINTSYCPPVKNIIQAEQQQIWIYLDTENQSFCAEQNLVIEGETTTENKKFAKQG